MEDFIFASLDLRCLKNSLDLVWLRFAPICREKYSGDGIVGCLDEFQRFEVKVRLLAESAGGNLIGIFLNASTFTRNSLLESHPYEKEANFAPHLSKRFTSLH